MLSRFTFVHASDLHLDSPFRGVHRTSPRVADALAQASLEAWDKLVALAVDREAAFVLLAGGLCDAPVHSVRAQVRFLQGLEELDRQGIRTLMVHGERDPLDGWPAISSWPASVTLFGSTAAEAVTIERDGQPLATIHGMSVPDAAATENLVPHFARTDEPGLHVGLLHCSVNGRQPRCSPCTLKQLKAVPMDYWALGHVHEHRRLAEGEPWVVYPGALQGRGTEPSEAGPKGAVVVTVEDGRIGEVAFEPLDVVRSLRTDVNTKKLREISALRRALTERAAALHEEHGGRHLIIHATLTGRGPIHTELSEELLAHVLDDLRADHLASEALVWWDSLTDDTDSQRDRKALTRRGDLASEVLERAEALGHDPERLAALVGRQFDQLGAAGLPTWAAESGSRDGRALLARAERLALDLLEGDEPS